MPLKIDKSKKHNFPKDELAWIKFINDLHDSAVNERQTQEAQWARNIAYYQGFQHLMFDPAIKLVEIDHGASSEDYIINRIAPFVEQRIAKITRAKPITTVLPDKMDPLTVQASKLSEELTKYIWKIDKKDDKLDTAILLMCLMGSSFWKTIWNSYGGEPIKDEQDEEGNIEFDENTGQQKMQVSYLGDIETHVRSAFDILVSRGAKDIPSADWVIERSHKCILEVMDIFDTFEIDKVAKKNEMTRFEEFVYRLGATIPGLGGTKRFDGNEPIDELDVVLIKEFWLKPNDVYPKGVLATVCGNQLLQFDEWPYWHAEFPFQKFDEHKNPFGFYGTSTVTRLLPIQQHYNEVRTQIAKNCRLMANVKWWVPKGAGLAEDALTDEQGEVIETNPNVEIPRQLPVAPLPEYVIANQEQDIRDIRDVGGEREASQLPFPNLTAGVALETAAELSDISLGPIVRNVERAVIGAARQELMLANQLYTDERILKIFGPGNSEYVVKKFKNTDLKDQTDVIIQLESGIGQSKAAMRQNMIDLWDRRVITDPERLLNAYVTGNIDSILKERNLADEVVIEQIEQIKEGAMPQVLPTDDSVRHIKKLSEFIQTPEFRRLSPDRQQLAVQTLQQYLMMVQPMAEPQPNPAGVNTPFGAQVPEGTPPV